MLVIWTENLSVGIEGFDDDHKRLIRMINELHCALEAVDAEGMIEADQIEIILHRLQNYVQYHCFLEEKYMEQTGFAGVEEHRKEHRCFIAAVTDMTFRFRGSRSAEHASELMHFMHDWLTHHIYETDKKYSPHLRPEIFSNGGRPRMLGAGSSLQSHSGRSVLGRT